MEPQPSIAHFSSRQKIIAAVVLLLVIIGVILVATMLAQRSQPPIPVTTQTPTPTSTITTVVTKPVTSPTPTIPADSDVYVMTEAVTDNQNNFYVNRLPVNATLPAEKVFNFNGDYRFHSKYRIEPELIVSKGSQLISLNVLNRTGSTIFDLKASEVEITSAYFDSGQNAIYYIQLGLGTSTGLPETQLWKYDLNTKQSMLITSKKLNVFSSWTIKGIAPNGELIVLEYGNNNGEISGDLLTINVRSNSGQQKIIQKEHYNFLNGKLSPSMSKWLYESCTDYVTTNPNGLECPDGERLVFYDFGSRRNTVIYQNLVDAESAERGRKRAILTSDWIDDNRVVFTKIDGFYSIALSLKEPVQTVYTFSQDTLDNQFNASPNIVYADDQKIIYWYKDPTPMLMRLTLNDRQLVHVTSINPNEKTLQFTRIRS